MGRERDRLRAMIGRAGVFLAKAQVSLAGAESEFANGRFNNVPNRVYYACFQAAVYALAIHGFAPRRGRGHDNGSHEALQATFVGELINRRKVYPSEVRDVLVRLQLLRNTADYDDHWVTEVQASRALRNARRFVSVIEEGE